MATDLVDAKDVNGCQRKPLNTKESENFENETHGEEYSETKALLSSRRGGTARMSDKTRRKVQWNDKNGKKLAEVVEFEPSEASDSEDEDSESCICTIM
ncbi:hypothetical protein KPL70_001412 [Citrus sinensis]|uniref:Uncharacterized protein n=4 Tax=Citrus TaxID=2706 RepID=A0ACB8I3Y9_CITSI|nr:uncharacterized protein LOC18032646 [Citrus x clementina]XP_006489650.1 uncharacterized protein LOC102608381 [Citrus sinensis]GAY46658.1 hypothetical protein CUMW_098750 [Citrus unshiu]ESR33563.1 hypothetical protein CICLE_v10006301mg [Citrus x clementina]KAH9681751.1 hypothetical protein KPL71_027089 [Citrus sinensis]KAH9764115.1 hypothetical protein KPL70_001412 [Citrus sinensis]KDO54109.1 hypothetical protein CISIN_1g034316mg [Citrus sinensis]